MDMMAQNNPKTGCPVKVKTKLITAAIIAPTARVPVFCSVTSITFPPRGVGKAGDEEPQSLCKL
jgi:hypothetical protein